MSRLNYSKWDALELSDDSDQEVHPNIDKKSWIRFQQRNIHEKRDQRRAKIRHLQMEIEMNAVMLHRIEDVTSQLQSAGHSFLQQELLRLNLSTDASKPAGSSGPSYDEMMASLLQQVALQVREEQPAESDRSDALCKAIERHRHQLTERTAECRREISSEEAQAKRKITSEDIREGFSTSHVSKEAASKQPVSPSSFKGGNAQQSIEVLNPPSLTDTSNHQSSPLEILPEGDVEEEVPELIPAARAFATISSGDWPALYSAVSQHPDLLASSSTDALLIEAFSAAMKGENRYSFQCVHQALLIQYCGKLGRDGVALFFKRMHQGPARKVFEDDVSRTYTRLSQRAKTLAHERASGASAGEEAETIQLVATDENSQIGFDVPDGAPPEHLVLEGDGTENIDIEAVREYLQNRWNVFESFSSELKAALQSGELEQVNHVLGKMSVSQAEGVIRQLDQSKIMRFSSSEIVDTTRS